MTNTDRNLLAAKALLAQINKGEGEMTQEEIAATFKALGFVAKRKPVRTVKVKKPKRGIGSY